MANSIIIFGSARNDGNTAKAVELIKDKVDSDFIDLNQLNISYFDYEHSNSDDDFLPTAEKLLKYDSIIFATPVYWYSMSAIMKTFFDRLTDLVTIRKDIGKLLAGKSIFVVSTSAGEANLDFFIKPFEATADYFNMNYEGSLNLRILNDALVDNYKQIDDFAQKILK